MHHYQKVFLAAVIGLINLNCVCAQFPPKPENVTILNSKFNDGVYISYKEVGIGIRDGLSMPY